MRSSMILVLCLIAAGMIFSARLAQAQGRPTVATRSPVLARNGMAATSQPLATQAAIRVLREGGNAIDAAIAANAVQGVVEPMSCGVGGDLFAIVWHNESGRLYGLNASGRAPKTATIAAFRERGLTEIPTKGPLSWSVPGCVDGWEMLHARFGSKSMSEILASAIEYAEQGFPVSPIIASSWKASEPALAAIPSSAAAFLPGGRAPAFAEVFRNPDLARTLRTIAERGPDDFYRGGIASKIADYSKSVGGLLALEDLQAHRGEWTDPVSIDYRGYTIHELPPNGQGIAALQMLALLEPFDLKSMPVDSPERLHLMIEAKKLAYEDRAKFYADPAFGKLPIAELISDAYADRRRKLIDPDRASDRPLPGEPAQADTIYLTVVDSNFNAVSLIQSNFEGFGSDHVPTGLGFPLQNRGCLFALDPKHANRLEPGKRPFHTIIPGFVTKDGKPWLSFGVMGGDMQAQGHAQVLSNIIDLGMDVQQAGDAPRFRHFGSSTPTGIAAVDGGTVGLEDGISDEVRRALAAKGHRVVESRAVHGGYQAIRIDVENRVLIGGSDPRKDGCAIGW
jgi:gamma-glutamyltranspeptidase/glutathione hydrolase